MTNKIKSKGLHTMFAWGQVCPREKSLLCQTVAATFSWSLRHNGPFREVCFLHRNQPIFPNLPFPVFTQNKPSNGNTLLHNRTLASRCLHLHN